MKFFQVLLVVACIYAASAGRKLSDEEKQMVKGQLKNCQKTEGATDDQVDNFLSGKDLNTPQAKCMAICALEQFAVVEKQADGSYKLNKENCGTFMKMETQDEEKLEKMNKMIDACNKKVTQTERCEYPVDLFKCLKEESDANGMKMDE